jgi:Leucine-rich repeat (LRR) protein
MDQKFLIGAIPIYFGELQSLRMLNLSHNNLSGNIPVVLGHLTLLNNLDLSYNNLQGEIPMDGILLHLFILKEIKDYAEE